MIGHAFLGQFRDDSVVINSDITYIISHVCLKISQYTLNFNHGIYHFVFDSGPILLDVFCDSVL